MLLLSLVACGTSPDLTSMENALGAAVPIAFASAHAWGWHTEAMIEGCDAADGIDGVWAGEVTLGGACPIPAIGGASGIIGVSGQLDDDGGALAAEFTRAEGLRLNTVAAFSVTPEEGLLRVLFVGGDVAMTDPDVGLSEVALMIEVDLVDPIDGTDDVYTIDGAIQVLGAANGGDQEAHTDQVTFTDIVVQASCGKNPVGGHMIAQQVDAASGSEGNSALIEDLYVTFDDACDGTAEIVADAGINAASSGQSVEFDVGR